MSRDHVLSIDTESTGSSVSPTTSNETDMGPESFHHDLGKSVTSTHTEASNDSLNLIKMSLDNRHVKYLKKRGISLSQPLAQGTFSQVYKINTNKHDKTVALKVIKIRTTKPEKFRFLKREIKAVRNLTHSGIVSVYSVFKSSTMVFIVMEHMENGTIHDYLRIRGTATEALAAKWTRGLASALEYIHGSGWAHRDLKVENIGLTRRLEAKLLDFGFARECLDPVSKEQLLSATKCGSIPYVAPESIPEGPHDPRISDIWSLGVTMYVAIVKKFPFSPKTLQHLYHQQMNQFWAKRVVYSNISVELFHLLSLLLEPNCRRRVTAGNVLSHEFVSPAPLISMMERVTNELTHLQLDTNNNK